MQQNRYQRTTFLKTSINIKNVIFITTKIILIILIAACNPVPDYRPLIDRDIRPPMFLGIDPLSSNEIKIHFNEPVEPMEQGFFISSHISSAAVADIDFSHIKSINNKNKTDSFEKAYHRQSITLINNQDTFVVIQLDNTMIPGKEYAIEGSVRNAKGNTLTFITSFYGYNSSIPKLLINEFNPRGSGNNPEKVEIRVLSDGNTAGVTLFEGTKENWNQKKILPAIDVKEDDYIVIHFRSTGDSGEIDEIIDQGEATAPDAHPEAWDLWVEEGSGLSTNNGVLALYTSPRGELINGVIYSNRTSASDDRYRGFGTRRMQIWADNLQQAEGWVTQGDKITPEEAIDPDGSTATRSICRASDGINSNSPSDWHIVPTRGSTFGEKNSDARYTP